MTTLSPQQYKQLVDFASYIRYGLNKAQANAIKNSIYNFYMNYYTNEPLAYQQIPKIKEELDSKFPPGTPITKDISNTIDIENKVLNEINESKKPSWFSKNRSIILFIIALIIIALIVYIIYRYRKRKMIEKETLLRQEQEQFLNENPEFYQYMNYQNVDPNMNYQNVDSNINYQNIDSNINQSM